MRSISNICNLVGEAYAHHKTINTELLNELNSIDWATASLLLPSDTCFGDKWKPWMFYIYSLFHCCDMSSLDKSLILDCVLRTGFPHLYPGRAESIVSLTCLMKKIGCAKAIALECSIPGLQYFSNLDRMTMTMAETGFEIEVVFDETRSKAFEFLFFIAEYDIENQDLVNAFYTIAVDFEGNWSLSIGELCGTWVIDFESDTTKIEFRFALDVFTKFVKQFSEHPYFLDNSPFYAI